MRRERLLHRSCVIRGDEGAAVIEMAVTSVVFLVVLIGLMKLCFALYAYHATADLARQATRWAIVRGSTSCTNTPDLTDCNATSAQIQSYVAGTGLLNITTSDVTVAWLSASTSPPTTWSACSTGTCNAPGNEVEVTVTYPLTLSIPFLNSQALNITSTSQMVIAQ